MLPYLAPPVVDLPLGLKIDAFGVLSSAGTVVGAVLAARQARRYAPGDDRPLRDVATWAVLGGLLGGHFMHVFVYHPETLKEGFGVVLRVWEGLSSMGGLLGAWLVMAVWFRAKKIKLFDYLDALALGIAPGWGVARLGCFLVHDHPGVRSNFVLAVAFPGGGRHDLGLYDALVLFALAAVLWGLAVKGTLKSRPGALMGILGIVYSASRFGLDFLRAYDYGLVDARYLGLTPAQYVVMGLFVASAFLLARRRSIQ